MEMAMIQIPEHIKAVIFDLDGTLVDSMGMWKDIDIEFLGRFGIPLPDGLQETYHYDKLVIASGSSPKAPPIPGIRQKNIFQLKTLQDAEELKRAIS